MWDSLTDEDVPKLIYLSGHLSSSENHPEDAHAGDSRDLALDGFHELKRDWLIEFSTWLSECEVLDVATPDEAVDRFLVEKVQK